MNQETEAIIILIVICAGLILLKYVLRYLIHSATSKGINAIENSVHKNSNLKNGPTVEYLRDMYPEIAKEHENKGTVPIQNNNPLPKQAPRLNQSFIPNQASTPKQTPVPNHQSVPNNKSIQPQIKTPYLCTMCGASLEPGLKKCKICGTSLDQNYMANQRNIVNQNNTYNQNPAYNTWKSNNIQQHYSPSSKNSIIVVVFIIISAVVMFTSVFIVFSYFNKGGASDYSQAVKKYTYSLADKKARRLAKIMVPSSGNRRKAKEAAKELIERCDYDRESIEEIIITDKEEVDNDELYDLEDTFPVNLDADYEMNNPLVLRANIKTREVKETGRDGAVGFGEMVYVDHYTDYVVYQTGKKWFIIPMDEEYSGFDSLNSEDTYSENSGNENDNDSSDEGSISDNSDEQTEQSDDTEQSEQFEEENLFEDESLEAFLTQFCKGYCIGGPEEYNCDDYPDDALNIISNIASYGTPCVDFSLYPVSQPDRSYDYNDSQINEWFSGEGGVTYYKQDSVKWIATNIFNLNATDEEYNDLGKMAEDNHYFYREGSAEGDAFYVTGAFEPGDGYLYNTYAVIGNFMKIGDRYTVTYSRVFNRDDPKYEATYEAELEIKYIDGKRYWTMYKNHILVKSD